MRIGILGVSGRMGRMVATQAALAGAEVAGGVTLAHEVAPESVRLFDGATALAAECDVMVDFTHANAVQAHADALRAACVPWILGTTGLSVDDQKAVRAASDSIAVVQAANFSPGVNLILALARQLGAALPAAEYDAEIVEMHHRHKVDSPSGTALALGEAVARGRGASLAELRLPTRDGHDGQRPLGGIGFAALRGGQVVGDHTLVFAAADEQIMLTHRAFDRASFARGAVRAAFWVAGRSPGLYGMWDVLGMEAAR